MASHEPTPANARQCRLCRDHGWPAKNNTARIWDAKTGKAEGKAVIHESWVKSATLSPDGKRVLVVSACGARIRHEFWPAISRTANLIVTR